MDFIVKKWTTYLSCFAVIFTTILSGVADPAFAQETNWDRVIRLLQEQDARNQQIEAEVVALRAEHETDRRAQAFATEEGMQQARESAGILAEKLPDVVNALGNVPEEHLPNGLKERMVGCATTVQSVSKNVLEDQAEFDFADLGSCTPQEMREILNELDLIKNQTQQAWAQCRDAVLQTGKVSGNSLPTDIFGVARGDLAQNETLVNNLSALKDQLGDAGAEVTECAGQLSDIYDQAVNQENSAAAMAMMMNMAGTICASSGGNPYVCGAAFLVAILANLFSDGGGDGDGDGKSDGDGVEGDGTSSVAGISGGEGTEIGPKPCCAPPEPTPQPTPPGPTPIIGGALDGKFTCSFSSFEWECLAIGDQTKVFGISANRLVQADVNTDGLRKSNSVLRSILSEGRGSDIAFCTGSADVFPPAGLIAYDGDRYFPMNVVQEDNDAPNNRTLQIRLVDDQTGEAVPDGGRNANEQCKAVVQ